MFYKNKFFILTILAICATSCVSWTNIGVYDFDKNKVKFIAVPSDYRESILSDQIISNNFFTIMMSKNKYRQLRLRNIFGDQIWCRNVSEDVPIYPGYAGITENGDFIIYALNKCLIIENTKNTDRKVIRLDELQIPFKSLTFKKLILLTSEILTVAVKADFDTYFLNIDMKNNQIVNHKKISNEPCYQSTQIEVSPELGLTAYFNFEEESTLLSIVKTTNFNNVVRQFDLGKADYLDVGDLFWCLSGSNIIFQANNEICSYDLKNEFAKTIYKIAQNQYLLAVHDPYIFVSSFDFPLLKKHKTKTVNFITKKEKTFPINSIMGPVLSVNGTNIIVFMTE